MKLLYRLALQCGIWDVEQWQAEISPEQVDGWMAYYELEPWGQPAADRRIGQLAAVIGAANGMQIDPDLIATGAKMRTDQTAGEQQAAVTRHVQGHRINAGLE